MPRAKYCLSPTVTDSEDFLEMPDSEQLAYIRLVENASICGVVDGAKRILKSYNHDPDLLDDLIEKEYLLTVDRSHVIRHWWVNNNKDKMHNNDDAHKHILLQLVILEDRTYCLKSSLQIDYEESLIEENRNESKSKSKSNISRSNDKTFTAPCPQCGTTSKITYEKHDEQVKYYLECPKCKKIYEVDERGLRV